MAEPEPPKMDRHTTDSGLDMETLIGHILEWGVLLSVAFIVSGLIWLGLITGNLRLNYTIRGLNLIQLLLEVVRQLIATGFGPRLLVTLGLITLLLTPYVRVLASVIYFALVLHNAKYTVFTSLVLAALTYSLFLR